MRRARAAILATAAAAWVLAAGCGSSTKASPDAQTDTGTDAGTDTGTDMPVDTGTDAGTDTAPDPATDPGTDTAVDTAVDTGTDTAVDTAPDGPLPDGSPSGGVGDPCGSSADCMGVGSPGRFCLTDVAGYIYFPGGYCSAACASDGECGPDGDCVDFYSYGSYCLRSCAGSPDCRTAEGYFCSTIPGGDPGTYCLPPMSSPDGGVDY